MQKTTLNLAAIISAALLTACGGSSDETVAKALVPAPSEPNAAETAEFHASKQYREEAGILCNRDWQPYDCRGLPAGFAAYNGTYTNRDGSRPVKVRSY